MDLFVLLESRVKVQRDHALFIASLQAQCPSGTAFQHLADHSPDWRYVASHFVRSEVGYFGYLLL